jgi:SAM-dependent methyltransferase
MTPYFESLRRRWDKLGRDDPLWAVLSFEGMKGRRWDPDVFFETGVRDSQSLIRRLEQANAWPIGGSALDFGCGVGRLTQALAPHFDEVVGVDIAPSMVERARQFNRFPERVSYAVNDRPDLTLFPAARFDFAFSLITLQHMKPELALSYVKELVRVLKKGGILLIQAPTGTTPTIGGLLTRATPSRIRGWYRGMEMHALRRERVTDALVQSGAEVLLISQDTRAGRRWHSLQYIARKRSL